VTDIRLNALLIDPAAIGSVALRRLVEEVRHEHYRPGAYDRVHNRHNRSGGSSPWPPYLWPDGSRRYELPPTTPTPTPPADVPGRK
jgi:hypothetical protein